MLIGFVMVFLALLVLSILVLVHELGHFLIAKRSGVWVEEFGLGLPPRIWGKKIGDTVYSINALPIGGFVRLHGEEGTGITDPTKAFSNKKKITRAAITAGGIVMNFLFAILCFSLVYSIQGIPKEVPLNAVKVLDLASGGPAVEGGLLVGDLITKVNKTTVAKNDEFIKLIDENKGKKVLLEIQRANETKKITVTPRLSPPPGEGALGVTIASSEVVYTFPPLWQRPFVGAYYGIGEAFSWSKNVIGSLGTIAREAGKGQVPQDLAGPVTIVALIAEFIRKYAKLDLIRFLGIFSINLAVLNLIPFPPLDGSRLLSILIEKLFGKKILPKVENILNTVGMFLLIALMIFLTARELPKLIKAGSLSGFVNSILKQ